MQKKSLSLIEVLLVVSVLAILLSLLIPSLRRARSEAKTVSCMSNLRGLGQFTAAFAGDNDNKIPSTHVWYDNNLYTGHRDDHQSWRWYNFLEAYGAEDNDAFTCASRTIHYDNNGSKIDNHMSYWVNTHTFKVQVDSSVGGDSRGYSPWMNNWRIRDKGENKAKREFNVKFTSLYNPSTLASIYDCAQGNRGWVPESGAGGFISHGPDVWDNPSPKPHLNSDNDRLIGFKEIPHQNGIPYWRGGIDFRHNGQKVAAVMFDGSTRTLRNGSIKNENFINQ
jgi:type II secretory pathway pseudopilin PulG